MNKPTTATASASTAAHEGHAGAGEISRKKQTSYALPRFNGTICHVTMQCMHPESGEIGDWAYVGLNHRDPSATVSPLFSDCVECFRWLKANGFESVGYDYIYRGAGTHGQAVENAMLEKHPNLI